MITLRTIFNMSPGSIRRKYILAWIHVQETMPGLPVNNKHQFNIEHDRDLQILLKKGLVKRTRSRCSFRKGGKHQTYLVVA